MTIDWQNDIKFALPNPQPVIQQLLEMEPVRKSLSYFEAETLRRHRKLIEYLHSSKSDHAKNRRLKKFLFYVSTQRSRITMKKKRREA